METGHGTFGLVLALAAGVVAHSAARHTRMPSIVLLLGAGVALGPDGLGWVQPRALGNGLFAIVDLAVAVILFEGGLNLDLTRLRREQVAIRRLVTIGALTTLFGAAVCAHWILGWSWALAALFGSLVVVTGPTVVGPLVEELRLKQRAATVLNAEGVLIDPIGAILAVLTLELVLSPLDGSLWQQGLTLLLRLGFGTLAGAIAGLLLGTALRSRRLIPDGLQNIFVLASVLLLMQGCEELISHSGILAVTIAGVVVGNMRSPVSRDLMEFKDQLTALLIGLLFIMLAADVRFEHVQQLGWPGAWVLAALVFVVRPLCVAISTVGSELSWRERVFVGWIAPRGIVAAAVASVVAGTLESQQLLGGVELRAMVFLSIGGTVVLAGLTAGPVGNWLGVRQPSRDTVAILGAEGLGFLLASELRAAGRPVVFIDSNPQHCRRAEEGGFTVVFGSAIKERTLQRAGFHRVATAVGLTSNRTLNGVFVTRAKELFGVPRALVAPSSTAGGLSFEMVESEQADAIFEGPHDIERWDVRERHGEVAVERLVYQPPSEPTAVDDDEADAPVQNGEKFVILSIFRAGEAFPMSQGWRLEEGDIASIAIHRPDLDESLAALKERGWVDPDDATPVEPAS